MTIDLNQTKIDLSQTKELKAAVSLLKRFEEEGHCALIVGGAVRNILLGIPVKDVDISTNMPIDKMKSVFSCSDIGQSGKFGVQLVHFGSHHFEVAHFRSDGDYSDGRRPDTVRYVSQFEEDAARRDFTINAMGADFKGNLIDDFGGLIDLSDRVIRTVHSPRRRFEEDHLRMLRAVRFAVQLNFRIDSSVRTAIIDLSSLIEKVAQERVREELCKMAVTGRFHWAIKMMWEYGLLYRIFPEVLSLTNVDHTDNVRMIHQEGRAFFHTLLTMVNSPATVVSQFAALLHDIGKVSTAEVTDKGFVRFIGHHKVSKEMASEVMKRLCFDNDTREAVETLIRHHMNFRSDSKMKTKFVRKLMRKVGEELMPAMISLIVADGLAAHPVDLDFILKLKEKVNEVENSPIPVRREPVLSGRQVMDILHLEPGPAIGAAKDFLIGLEDDLAGEGTELTIEQAEKALIEEFGQEKGEES